MMFLNRIRADIDLDKLAQNYYELRKKNGNSARFLGVVKADAYGHGAPVISRTLQNLGAEFLAVSNIDEAAQLRRSCIETPILILGFTPPEYADYEAENGIRQEVHSIEYARRLNEKLNGTGKRLCIHIKLDTGMTRLGFTSYGNEADLTCSEITEISSMQNLVIEGVFQHFCCADILDADSVAFTKLQYQRFCNMLSELTANGINPEIRHCSNSAASIHYPEYAMDMVRPGIATYGYLPCREMAGEITLKPLMSLRSIVGQIRWHDSEISVSYGRLWRGSRKSRIAIIPIGYADGLDRHLSGNISFMIRGHAVPQVGRICMDMCMADITDFPDIAEGDDVLIFTGNDSNSNRLEMISDTLKTIEYEVLCGIGKRVPRIYYKSGIEIDTMVGI